MVQNVSLSATFVKPWNGEKARREVREEHRPLSQSARFKELNDRTRQTGRIRPVTMAPRIIPPVMNP